VKIGQKALVRLRDLSGLDHIEAGSCKLSDYDYCGYREKSMNGLFRSLWERHQRGYVLIALLLFLVAAPFRSSGWVTVIIIYVVILAALELLYRTVRSLAKRNKKKWWAKPRREVPRAYGTLAVAIVFVIVGSEIARSWALATVVGSIAVAAGIHFHRVYEERQSRATPD
jgi:hypothetical protein